MKSLRNCRKKPGSDSEELKRIARPQGFGAERHKSLGETYVESEAYEHSKSIKRANNVPVEWLRKDITVPKPAQALAVRIRNQNIYAKTGDRPIFIRQLVNSMPVQDSAVEIMRENIHQQRRAAVQL